MDLEKIFQTVSSGNSELLSNSGSIYDCQKSDEYKKHRYYKAYLAKELSHDDKPICYIGGIVIGHRCTGILMTTEGFFFKTLKDSFFSSILYLSGASGFISKKDLRSIMIGNPDRCYGYTYYGHQLLVNNEVMGLVNYSNWKGHGEESIEFAQLLFDEINKSTSPSPQIA
jgi:hypothetical protein